MEAEEGDLACGYVSFQCPAREIRIGASFQQAVLDHLVLHSALRETAERSVAAVEAHEDIMQGVREPALYCFLIHICRYSVVDIQQSHALLCYAGGDILGQGTVDVDLAGYRDSSGGQAAVHITWFEAELLREGRPALVRKGHIGAGAAVSGGPVQKRQLILGHPFQQVRICVPLPKLGAHLLHDCWNSGIALMLTEGDKEIKFAVLLNLDSEIVEGLYRGIAGKEILRPRSECYDLQVSDAEYGPGNRDEVTDHRSTVPRVSDRILRNIGRNLSQAEIVGAVEHPAVGISPSPHEVVASLLGCGDIHRGAGEILCEYRLRRLRTEIAQIDHQRIAAGTLNLFQRLQGILLILDDCLRLEYVDPERPALLIHSAPSLLRNRDDETVTAHSHKTQLDNWYVA